MHENQKVEFVNLGSGERKNRRQTIGEKAAVELINNNSSIMQAQSKRHSVFA
jgi:hypothetical protein